MFDDRINAIIQRYEELERLISDPLVIAHPEEFRKHSREHSSLVAAAEKARQYVRVNEEMTHTDALLRSPDPEMRAMAQAESEALNNRKSSLEDELKVLLLPPDPNENKDIIMEIRAGTGGDEAALFAGELFRMYSRYAESKGWKIELMDNHATGLGGFKEVIFNVSGRQVWKFFKFEKGIHRVQRVPVTEAAGRVHTSAVSVAVLPEAEEVDIEVRTEDLRIDTYRASGAGGQYINKTDSAIRMTHIPTGIVVACQDERSQLKNRAKALRLLRARLYEKKMEDRQNAIRSDRRQQIGSGDRSEKIRTYNFPQNRITDHRIEFSLYRLKDVLEGDLDELVMKLIAADQEQRLALLQ